MLLRWKPRSFNSLEVVVRPSRLLHTSSHKLSGGLENASRPGPGRTKSSIEKEFYKLWRTRYVTSKEPASHWLGTFVIPESETVKAEDILAQLPRLDNIGPFGLMTAVLLYTPRVASLLHQNPDFVAPAILQLGKSLVAQNRAEDVIRVVEGVVDKVPGPGHVGDGAPTASEGVSIYLTNQAFYKPIDYLSASLHQTSPAILRLKYNDRRRPDSIPKDQLDVYNSGYEVALPVANTLFLNGRLSTLDDSFWKISGRGADKHLDIVQGSRPLNVLTIFLPAGTDEGFNAIFPLQAVTPPRLLKTTMGNVMREIEVEGQAAPASLELEAVVNQLANSTITVDSQGKTVVYALVRDPPFQSPYLDFSMRQLERGARLFRVTGGGGGWGSKKGLLSLDPAIGFDMAPKVEDQNIAGHPEQPPSAQILGRENDIIRPGQVVQFFIHAPGTTQNTDGKTKRKQAESGATKLRRGQQMVMGCVPPEENSLHTLTEQEKNGASGKLIQVEGFFGAYSEGGLGITIQGNLKEERRLATEGKVKFKTLNRTRLDVPNGCLVIDIDLLNTPSRRGDLGESEGYVLPWKPPSHADVGEPEGDLSVKKPTSHIDLGDFVGDAVLAAEHDRYMEKKAKVRPLHSYRKLEVKKGASVPKPEQSIKRVAHEHDPESAGVSRESESGPVVTKKIKLQQQKVKRKVMGKREVVVFDAPVPEQGFMVGLGNELELEAGDSMQQELPDKDSQQP